MWPTIQAEVTYRGRAVKRVRVVGATPSTSNEDIFKVAMAVANEDRSSLFGWTVERLDTEPTVAVVNLWTD